MIKIKKQTLDTLKKYHGENEAWECCWEILKAEIENALSNYNGEFGELIVSVMPYDQYTEQLGEDSHIYDANDGALKDEAPVIKRGDVVVLKSASPAMVVSEISPDKFNMVEVAWYDMQSGMVHYATLSTETLLVLNEQQKKRFYREWNRKHSR